MATSRRNSNSKADSKKKTAVVDMGEGFFLHYRENEYGLFGLEHNGAVIYGCKIYEGDNGLFVSYPARKGNDGKYYAHARFKDNIPDSVIDKIADAIGF